ncbi:alpha/beta fold hydrolase [Zwartia vadi]|uniref:alpha/beta fold hydrolase n=1 Tax=Zwartia vadi TaxID=3058168 RepID=UPI0025B3B3F2|nr:alpha/beta hydrolase [Zwartia vadi]MDN3986139.1 alpha/beta hydrolase [Zwartia vadi]
MNKPTIVLAPGFMTDYDMWRDFVPFLKDYNVIYADFREGQTLQELAASNLSRCPERFILIGFSLGGYISRHMLYQAPERVEALVLIGTSTRPSVPPVTDGSATKMFRGMSRSALKRAVHVDRENDETLIARLKDMGERLGAEVFTRLSALERKSDLEQMKHIKCPVLVVTADQDRLRTMEESTEMAEAARAPLVVLKHCGHMMPMEEPEQLANIVLPWLADKRRT